MRQPLVSIIVTCYNQQDFITQTLKSVENQTYTEWECIIVDDGSNDNSQNAIKDFTNKDNRFRCIHQENAGVSEARNTGFALAKGRFINFLDGDDTFLPEKLKEQIEVFSQHTDFSVCICDHQYYNETKKTYAYYKFKSIEQRPLQQLLYGWHNGVAFPPHAVLYKRDVWSQNEKPFPEDYPYRCEDWVFNVLVALKGIDYYWLDKVLCNYHMSGSNYSGDQLKLSKAAIKAAYYLKPYLPGDDKDNFLDHTIEINLKQYLNSNRQHILESSKNWRIANKISRSILKIYNLVKI